MFKRLLLATTGVFLLCAGPANAMPAVVGGIGALLSTGVGGGLTLGSIALGVASMGAQWLLSMLLTPDQKQRGIKTRMETGGDNPPTFIVGEYATAGQLVYANTLDGHTNIPESCLVYVICLSALPIEAVSSEIFINNERCTIDTSETFAGGFYAVNEYVKGTGGGGYCSLKFHLGNQNDADDWLLDQFGSDPDRPWNNNMFLPGCAYAIIRCWYSNRGIWTGLPEFRFQIRGAKLYDPRKDSTRPGGSGSHRWGNQNTWEYTANPKVIEYNLHRGFWWDDKHQWGGQAEAYRLPLDYWFAAMNACDENISLSAGGTVKRFRIGAEISFDDKPIEIVAEINKSCSGYTTEFGGTYKTWVGNPGLSVGTITDDDFAITADMDSSPFQPRQNTFNTCYVTYPEPKQQWEPKDAPRYQDEDALDEDGEELPINLPLPFVSEGNQIQRLARAAIKDSRRQVTHSGQLAPAAWVYEPFDRLTYVSDQFGYDGKDFIISSKDDLPNVMQQIMLREWNPNDAGWLPAYEQEYDFDPLVVVKPDALELDFDVFADQVESAAGKDKPAIRAEWTWGGGIDLDVRRVDWQLRRAGQTKVIAEKSVLNPADNSALIVSNVLRWGKDYEIRFKPRPFAVRDSVWTGWKPATMLSVEVPQNLVLTAVSDLGADGKLDFFVKANWDDVAQETNGYGVKVTIDGDTRYYRADDSRFRVPVKAPSSVTIAVRTRAADGGTPSAWTSDQTLSVTKKGTAPTTPSSLSVTGRLRSVIVDAGAHPDADFRRWNIYFASVNNFASATKVRHNRAERFVIGNLNNGQDYYFWITAEDTSGNESAKYPSSNTAGVYAKTAKIDDDETEDGTLAAPSGLTLTKVQDTDEDGTVRTFIKMSCTAPAWATTKTTYVFAVTVAGDTFNVKSDDEVARYRVHKTGVLHTVKVKAVKGHGNKGAWSGNQTITPTKKAIAPTGATSVIIVPKAGKNVVKWTKSTEADYFETAIQRNTTNNFGTSTEIGRVTGNRFVDDEITKGQKYWYWAIDYNRSAAAGPTSTAIDGDARGIQYSDADNEVLSAPTGTSLSQANRDVDLDGTVDIALLATFSGGSINAKDYEFEISSSTSSGGTYTVIETKRSPSGKAWFAANTQLFYVMRVRPIAWDDTPGNWTSLVGPVQPSGSTGAPATPTGGSLSAITLGFTVSWTKPTELDYAFTEIAVSLSSTGPSDAWVFDVTSSAGANKDVFLDEPELRHVHVRHVNTSGLRSSWQYKGTVTPLAVGTDYIEGGAVGAINSNNWGTTGGNVSAGAGVKTLLLATVKFTSNTPNVTVTLGSETWTTDFVAGEVRTFHTVENGGGLNNLSKSGGTWTNAKISAFTIAV